MQRYRINYRLLIGLVVGTLFLAAIAFFFVHPWQVTRKANRFRESAAEAYENNNLREAFDDQYMYVRYRGDEDEARVKLANIAVDLSESEGATQEDVFLAYQILDETVRRTSDPVLRRKLADILLMFRRPQDAIVHIEELVEDDPDNSEIQALLVRALFATKDTRRASELALGLIGYDKQTNEFSFEKAAAADQPDIYALLADALQSRTSTRDKKLARNVIDQMTIANPESPDAHLKRSILLYKIGEADEAVLALEKAHELDPDSADILLREGQVAYNDKKFEEANKFFRKALELYPENIAFYQLVAQTEAMQRHFDEGIQVLDEGIKQFDEFDEKQSLGLISLKIDFLLAMDKVEAAKGEIDALEKVAEKNPPLEPIVQYQQARIKLHEKQWAEAAEALNKVRPLLFSFPIPQRQAGVLLGRAYERLGKFDLALQSYELVLRDQPDHPDALAGRQKVRKRIHPEEFAGGSNLNKIIQQTLALPSDQQNWDKVDEVVAQNAQERELTEAGTALLRAQVMLKRELYSEAKSLIQEAARLEPENVNVRLSAIKLLLADPSSGPDKALELLDKTAEEFGDSFQARALRAEILLARGGEELPQQLHALADGIDQWNENEQAQLCSTLGLAFQQLGMYDDAFQYWNRATTLLPNNLPVRMHLFELALMRNDQEVINNAQEKILELVHDRDDANYVLSEVRRRLMGFTRETVSREELLEARGMLDVALQRRPEWSDLHVAYGQLLVLLNEDLDLALQHLEDALKFGPANANAVALQVQLLAKRGQFDRARNAMDRIPTAARSKLLGSIEAELLLETGNVEEAYQVAEKIAEDQAEVAKTQEWFAKLAQRMGKLDAASEALRKATELLPASADNWTQLMALYAMQKKPQEFEEAYREARLAVDADFLPLIVAKSYEIRGLWQPAERIYLSVFEDRLEEAQIARRMAEFYLLWAQADPMNRKRAASYINKVLRASYEGRVSPNDQNVEWARNQAARQLASLGDYQQSLKALELVAQGAVDGKLDAEQKLLQAEILASLNDPDSQGKSIRLLTELQQNGQLQKKGVLLLAQLLRRANDWERCEQLMLNAIGTYGGDLQVWSTYVAMLIERGEYSKAQSRINRLEEIDSQGTIYKRLLALLAAKQGDQELVRKTLGALLPENIRGALNADQLQSVISVAQLAAECEDFELAERLYTLYVEKVPDAILQLTRFHAFHGDAGIAVQQMRQAVDTQTEQVLALAAQMLRKRRTELGDQYDEAIDQMVDSALRDDPGSAQRQLFRAEILEIEQKHEESSAAYDKLLKRDDVPPRIRATALNNLAFLLAMRGERLDEAEQYINQAMEILGPIAPLLDTRAVVAMAKGQYDKATEDLASAVTVQREPVLVYHLAKAQLLSGDEQSAARTWKEAVELGLKKEDLPPLEQSEFEEIKAKIEQTGK